MTKSPIYNILIALMLLFANTMYSQTVSFDCEVSDGSYGAISDYGDWYSNNALAGSGKQHSGSKAIRFRNTSGAYLVYEGPDGNGKDGGIGIVSFWYRHWDADGRSVKFKCQYSTDGGTNWTDIGSETTVTSTTYSQYYETVNVSGDDILFRILSTAFQERCLIDDIEITGHSGGAAPSADFSMTDDGSIDEASENSEVITIDLSNETFVANIDIANWTISNQPQGVSIGSINRINDTIAHLNLSGNRTKDYDADIIDFTISISNQELTTLNTGSISSSSGVTFTANNDAENITISDDGPITENSEDGEIISITLTGGTFTSILNSANWSFSNLPEGVSIGSINRISSNSVEITLSGNRTTDYDSDITNAEISIADNEIDDYSGANITKNTGITFTATNDAESISISDDGDITENSEDSEIITITLTGGTFSPTLHSANWSLSNAPQGVSIGSISRLNDNTAEITLSGNRTTDYDSDITDAEISITDNEIDDYSGANITKNTGITFTATDDPESITISDDGDITEGSEDGEILTVTLNGGTFISSINSANWSISNIPVGVSIGSISRININTAEITLSGNRTTDYDIDITNTEISITDTEIDYYSGANISKNTGITFTAVIEHKPTIQASDIIVNSAGSSNIDISWTRGDGQHCLVIVKEDNSVDSYPIDASVYNADSQFGNGDELGTGNFIVYNGNSNTVNITGLAQGKEYFIRVFEFNYENTNTLYDTNTAVNNPSSSFTSPNTIKDFSIECISKTSAYITWTPPVGSYDGIIIAMRESTNAVHVISGQGDTLIANTIFGQGDSIGSTTPKSFIVYNGIGNSVSVTGLTPGSSYTFKARTYINNLWSGNKTKTARVAEIKQVTNLQHYAPTREIVINWKNPSFNCPDEIMLVARKDSAVTTAPSGDGSAYTGNTTFGSGTDIGTNEFVIYKGTNNGVTITGLTNTETYYFSIYVRDGTSWSEPVRGNDTPDDISILFQGDLAILAINTDNSSHNDEISIVCFDTLKTGTAIDITDNGWERKFTDKWGSTEGVIRFTRTGPDILPGQVFTFKGKGHLGSGFEAFGLADNGWSVSSLNGNYDFNLNGSDQIWVMQYGSWTNNSGSHKATYSGNVLYGWTATGWAGDPGHGTPGSTSYSALYPFGTCFNTNVVGTANEDKVKYTGPTTAATQRDWVSRIKDENNWTGYSDNANFDGNGPDYPAGVSFSVLTNTYTDGEWLGTQDTNWYNCGNWAGLKVPDENTNVTITNTATKACVISSTAEYSDEFNDSAICKDLNIADSTVYLLSTDDILKVSRNIQITGGKLNAGNGTIILKGNWQSSNAAGFVKGNSKLVLSGDAKQSIENTVAIESFTDIELDNSSGVEILSSIDANYLKLSSGKFELNDYNLRITDSIGNYSSNRYIITNDDKSSTGHLLLNIANSNTIFPIGNTNTYTPIKINLSSGTGFFKARVFSNTYENGLSGNLLSGDKVDKTWLIEPKIAGAYTATIDFQWNLSDESSGFGSQHSSANIIYNNNTGTGTSWADWNLINNSGSINGLNPYIIQGTSINNFGSFGVGIRCVISKPQTSSIYHY